ncbi:MAG: hypothetical protein Kow0090_13830 [Myxococcota bacterium]
MKNMRFLLAKGGITVTIFLFTFAVGSTAFAEKNPKPELNSLQQEEIETSASEVAIVLNGYGLVDESVVLANNIPLKTKKLAHDKLEALIPPKLLAKPGAIKLKIKNPAPGGGISDELSLDVVWAKPVIESVEPKTLDITKLPQTVTVRGKGFVPPTTVSIAGKSNKPKTVKPEILTFVLDKKAATKASVITLSLHNPTPGGGDSDDVKIEITNPAPAIKSVTPNRIEAFSELKIAATGEGFIEETKVLSGATIIYSELKKDTIFFSVPDESKSKAGVFEFTLVNDPPGGGATPKQSIEIVNPKPTLYSVSPAVLKWRQGGNVNISGANFVAGATVLIADKEITPKSLSYDSIEFSVSAELAEKTGKLSVKIKNPTPGGGESAPQFITIENPTPKLTAIEPAEIEAQNNDITVKIKGEGFVEATSALVNGKPATAKIEKDAISVEIPAAQVKQAGEIKLQLANPAPGGGKSEEAKLVIKWGKPIIEKLEPEKVLKHQQSVVIIIRGKNFIKGIKGYLGEKPVGVVLKSESEAQIKLGRDDLATAGEISFKLENPSPGGGFSNELKLVVENPQPILEEVEPMKITAGKEETEVVLKGRAFVEETVALVNGVEHKNLKQRGPTRINLAFSPTELESAKEFEIWVSSPAPGGGTSEKHKLSVVNPKPILKKLNPDKIERFKTSEIEIEGGGIIPVTKPFLDATELEVKERSKGKLVALLSAKATEKAGVFKLSLKNPEPEGGASNELQFTVLNPTPEIAEIVPSKITTGKEPAAITVKGNGFVAETSIKIAGKELVSKFVDSNTIIFDLPESLRADVAILPITAHTPIPGGGAAKPVNLEIQYPEPKLNSLEPDGIRANSPPFELTFKGMNFVKQSSAVFDGQSLPTLFVSPEELKAKVPATAIVKAHKALVKVVTPTPGGGETREIEFIVQNPYPTLKSVSPEKILAGSPQTALTISGSEFVPGTVARLEGTELKTTFSQETQLSAVIPKEMLSKARETEITLFSPAPGGGESKPFKIVVENPVPKLEKVSPPDSLLSDKDIEATLFGAGFNETTVASLDDKELSIKSLEAGKLTVIIPAVELAKGMERKISCKNPPPLGGKSNEIPFTVKNPLPKPSSLAPQVVIIRSKDFEIKVAGEKFVPGAKLLLDDKPLQTDFLSESELKAVIPTAKVSVVGKLSVSAENPPPGGGKAGKLSLSVENPLPSLSAMTPAEKLRKSGAFTLTLTGKDFVKGAKALWEGKPLATDFVSYEKLTVKVPETNIEDARPFKISVENPSPGGGKSKELTFLSTNPEAEITALSPNEGIYAQKDTTLTITGKNFVETAMVFANGKPIAVKYQSPTKLEAKLPDVYFKEAGKISVTVSNPSPGGGGKGELSFAVNYPAPEMSSLNITEAPKDVKELWVGVAGKRFVPASVVRIDGKDIKTEYESPEKLRSLVSSEFLDKARALKLAVYTPPPGGGTSSELALTVKNPTPIVGGITPEDILAEGPDFDITITGKNFVKDESVIIVNETPIPTRFISPTKLEGKAPARFIMQAGALPIKVRTQEPGGGDSITLALKVTYSINTLTGAKEGGFAGDGDDAAKALISKPTGVALDNQGNVYIADTGNSRIRKIDAKTKTVSTIAGNEEKSYLGDGGPARKASLKYPADVAVDALGNIYIADTENHAVRKIDRSTGNITTVAGIGMPGLDREVAANKARLNTPIAITLDIRGNLYIADFGNAIVRKVDVVSGKISIVAGSGMTGFKGGGAATEVNLDEPAGIAVDRRGFIYISARGAHRILRVNPTNNVLDVYAGTGEAGFSGDGGAAKEAKLYGPTGLALDSEGNLYFADSKNNRIRKIDARSGIISTVAGSGEQGFEGDGERAVRAKLNTPRGIAVSKDNILYIADFENNRIRFVGPTKR